MANRTIIVNGPDDTGGRAKLREAFASWERWPLRVTFADGRRRSLPQNSRHWAILEACGYQTDAEKMEAHYGLLAEFFGTTEPDKLGRRRPVKTSSELTPAELSALDDWICRRAAGCGIIIPP